MLSRIAFIAPNREMYKMGKKINEELHVNGIEFYLGRLNHGVDIARKLEAEGVDVIVTRGGTAELILKSDIKTPVVEIPITGQDLACVLYEAKKITGLDKPKIAILAFENMIYDIETLSRAMNIDILVYKLNKEEDIKKAVGNLLGNDIDIVVGGIFTIRCAAKLGYKTLLLTSGESSFRTAFMEAQKVAYARKIEKEMMQQFKVLVDFSVEGIINVDKNGRINVFNVAAERLLGMEAEKVLGRDINEIFPQFKIEENLAEKKERLGEILNINNVNVIANIAPIEVSNEIIGNMITFQDVTKVQEMEAKIRKEFYSKGLIAKYNFNDILGTSDEIAEAKRIAREFAPIEDTVLITGASGTGKELFAQSMHNCSLRSKGPFVAINCAAIPPNLLESELFGYVDGAFTGANKKGKPGLFEIAHGGTIFLDEISEMDLPGQSRLLRVIQERQIMRLGDDRLIPIDVRIISATNKNLYKQVCDSRFRQDLYYRLNVLTLTLPTLKERGTDIVFLANHFLGVYNKRFCKKLVIDDDAMLLLCKYEWPGNVRELKNVIERLVVMARGERIGGEMVKHLFYNTEFKSSFQQNEDHDNPVNDITMSEKEKLIAVLTKANFNIREAASYLGINRSTVYRKIRKYNIQIKKFCNI